MRSLKVNILLDVLITCDNTTTNTFRKFQPNNQYEITSVLQSTFNGDNHREFSGSSFTYLEKSRAHLAPVSSPLSWLTCRLYAYNLSCLFFKWNLWKCHDCSWHTSICGETHVPVPLGGATFPPLWVPAVLLLTSCRVSTTDMADQQWLTFHKPLSPSPVSPQMSGRKASPQKNVMCLVIIAAGPELSSHSTWRHLIHSFIEVPEVECFVHPLKDFGSKEVMQQPHSLPSPAAVPADSTYYCFSSRYSYIFRT